MSQEIYILKKANAEMAVLLEKATRYAADLEKKAAGFISTKSAAVSEYPQELAEKIANALHESGLIAKDQLKSACNNLRSPEAVADLVIAIAKSAAAKRPSGSPVERAFDNVEKNVDGWSAV